MKVSVDQRRLKARQMLVEASWARSALIKALKDDNPVAAKKALNDLVSAQGYASSPAEELGLTDQQFKELSGALQKPGPGNMEIVRKILGVGKTEKPQQKSNVPGHVQKAQQKSSSKYIFTPEEKKILQTISKKVPTAAIQFTYEELVDINGALSMMVSDPKVGPELDSLSDKIYNAAKTNFKYKDSDFPDI